MNLLDLVGRTDIPTPWDEGDNIPWDDPVFSQRMLKEHLTQEHDAASRRSEAIDRQVEWIHQKLLLGHLTGILDLACGPGLYSSRLANLGHRCVGIDYSPASIAYAKKWADKGNLDCTYLHQDIRTAEYGARFGLAMLIYGEFNVFRITDARTILKKAYPALNKHGILLLEPHTLAAVKKIGEQGTLWYSSHSGLFSNKPHLCLEEHFWDEISGTTAIRYFIVDASSGDVTRYAQTFQAYSNAEYQSVLTECGFDNVEFFPSLAGTEDYSQDGLTVIVAQKK